MKKTDEQSKCDMEKMMKEFQQKTEELKATKSALANASSPAAESLSPSPGQEEIKVTHLFFFFHNTQKNVFCCQKYMFSSSISLLCPILILNLEKENNGNHLIIISFLFLCLKCVYCTTTNGNYFTFLNKQ